MTTSNLVDRISALPDDVLLSIVSLFQLSEAVTTSVLSTRWRYLWTCTDGVFDLDYPMDMSENSIERVNHVLDMHRGCKLDELKASIDFEQKTPVLMERLIEFAMKKRVKTLALDLCYNRFFGNYALRLSDFRNYNGLLSSLRLDYVNVADDVIGWILCNSPLLQALRVCQSQTLINLKVTSPLPNLRHLEIIDCINIHSVDLNVKNLVSCTYHGPKTVLRFKELPYLTRANFDYNFFTIDACHFSRYFSRLESLVLDVTTFTPEQFDHPEIPKLPMLKNLEYSNVSPWEKYLKGNLKSCTMLLKASPRLHVFVLKIKDVRPSINGVVDKATEMLEEDVKYQHNQAKVVQITGYREFPNYAELVRQVLEKFPCVEKVTVQPLANN